MYEASLNENKINSVVCEILYTRDYMDRLKITLVFNNRTSVDTVCVCLYRAISLDNKQIWLSFTIKILLGPGHRGGV